MRGNRAKRGSMTQGNAGAGGGMNKRGVSVAFIEEGRRTSFIGGCVSPQWCHGGQHRINHTSLTHLCSSSLPISPPLLFFLSPSPTPPSFLTPVSLSLAWEVITAQSANQINSHYWAVAEQKRWPLVWNVTYNGCNVPLLTAHRSRTRGHMHSLRRGLTTHTHASARTNCWHLALWRTFA